MKPPRPSSAQARREAEAAQSLLSMRAIYRQLASALHPDREPDAQLRDEKTALMKRVNTAYGGKDLLALLSLQLECRQIGAAPLATAPPAQLKLYNKALLDQLNALRTETLHIEQEFCLEFAMDLRARLSPETLMKTLESQRKKFLQIEAEQANELRLLDDPVSARAWLKVLRQQQRVQAMDDDWF